MQKWIDYVVYHKSLTCEIITQKKQMEIKEENISYNDEIINIVKASCIGDFRIDIPFSNDTLQIVDFKKFLLSHKHPDIQKYRDEKLIASFSIINGNLNWNDFDMIFPVSDLMDNSLEHTSE